MRLYLIFLLFRLINSKIIYVRDFGIINNENSINASIQNGNSFYDAIKYASYGDTIIISENETLYYIPSEEYIENINNILIQIDGKIILYNDTSLWEKTSSDTYFNAIDIRNSNNLTITGNGTIYGQGYTWWKEFLKGEIVRERPSLINIDSCTDVIIENITLLNSPRFNIYANYVLRFVTRNMKIWVDVKQQKKLLNSLKIPIFPFNTDGVDVKGKQIHIYNMTISNYDDSVAVKPSKNKGLFLDNQNMSCSEDILIENINVKYGVGLSIGSVSTNNNYCIRNVIFQNIHADTPIKFIYIKTEEGSDHKSIIDNITYQNMSATKPILWPIYIGPQQQKEPDGTGSGIWPPTNPFVEIQNIYLKNIHITETIFEAGLLRCNISNPCKNIIFENVVVKGKIKKNAYVCDKNNSVLGTYDKYTSPQINSCGLVEI
tara:strand:+ start:592 stop:1890 length:1299 start_codon:yes stop_codon:yes gene_type:complete